MSQTIINFFGHPVIMYYTGLSLGVMIASLFTAASAEIANIYVKEGFPK